MTDKPTAPKLEIVPSPPHDALDIEALWLDPALGDGLTDTSWHAIPVGKPRDFFRVHPDPDFRRRTEIYAHKIEGADRHGVLHSGPEDARAAGGGAAVRSRHLHLSRRLSAAVAVDVPARRREGQHRLVNCPGRGAGRDRQVGASGLEQAIVPDARRAARIRTRPGLGEVAGVQRTGQGCVRPARRHSGHRRIRSIAN